MVETILVTGGTGLVGKAIEHISNNYEYKFVFLSSGDGDLTKFYETDLVFTLYEPTYVIHLAACVGGLFKNMAQPVNMFEKNMLINMNVLRCCHKYNVRKVISCLSTCIFPDRTTYPINENMLHNGAPHDSNSGYAYAKRMLEVQSRMYCKQYNVSYVCVIPTNIYGPHDNFSLTDGHVIPSLIHKCYTAKQNDEDFIVLGTGKPLRQFIYSHDLAELLMWTLNSYNDIEPIILSVSEDQEQSIECVSKMIAKEYDYEDRIVFDNSYSDGQYKKTADNSKLTQLHGQYNFTSLDKGIKETIEWFNTNYNRVRK